MGNKCVYHIYIPTQKMNKSAYHIYLPALMGNKCVNHIYIYMPTLKGNEHMPVMKSRDLLWFKSKHRITHISFSQIKQT